MQKKSFEILQLGDPRLRKAAKPIEAITAQHQILFDDLLDFVVSRQGAGIAAPQVGLSERFFIMASKPNERYPNAPNMEPIVIINPEIISHSDNLVEDWEGCLSIPGIRGLVPRYSSVTVKYLSRSGEEIKTRYSGFIARIFQHEIDHLNGAVFLDRIENNHNIMMEQEWLKTLS
ncbi:MAG: peptide deformylase [Methylophaga sp.]|nr:peptide deformylase [Methylophaga sp.]